MKHLLDDADIEAPISRIDIKPLGSLDSIDFPVSVPVQAKAVREEVLDASEGLDNLTQLALDKAKEILEMKLIAGDEDFNAILKAQVSQVQTILTTQARVDEGRFKKKQVDKLGELLDLIRGEEAKLIPGRVLN